MTVSTLELHVRLATVDDLRELQELETAATSHPWSRRMLEAELEYEWSRVLIAESFRAGSKEIVSFAVLWTVADDLQVLNVATHPSYRRLGAASKVIGEALNLALAKGCRVASLEVRRSNDAAIKLYTCLGFRRTGIRFAYYADNSEDAVVMIRDL
jgi:ribosomal-protein-alanine N-acetyltransferase